MDRRLYGRGGGISGNGFNGSNENNGTRLPAQSQPVLTPAYMSFLDAYFEHVRDTSAMFRSISDALRTTQSQTTPTSRSGPFGRRASSSSSSSSSGLNSNANAHTANIRADDDVDFISGVTFNLPIHDTDTNIFNLLASYINNPHAAAAAAGAASVRANHTTTNTNNTQATIATNTVSMRYTDIEQDRRTYDLCPITGDAFTNDAPVLMMHCGHYFSRTGLTRWLERHTTCPVCRYDFGAVAGAAGSAGEAGASDYSNNTTTTNNNNNIL